MPVTEVDGRGFPPADRAEMRGRMPSDRFRYRSETPVHQGAVVAFNELVITDDTGAEYRRDVVRHPGAVSVLPFDGTNVTLVRQYRASIDGDLYELPAGKRDVGGEPPVDTARRELAEEVGLEADSMELLVNLHHSAGFCDEYGFIFLARDLRPVDTNREGPEEQAMSVHTMALAEAVAWCFDGRITDAKTLIGLLALEVRERSRS